MMQEKMIVKLRQGRAKTFLLLAVILGAGVFPCVFAEDKIVAVANNDVITQKDLDEFSNFLRMEMAGQDSEEAIENKIQEAKSDLLNKLVDDRLILQEAKKSKVQVDEAKIKAKIAEIKRQYPSEDEFRQMLLQHGLSQADIEARIRDQLLMLSIIETKVKKGIVVMPSEITKFFEDHKSEFDLPEERQLEVVTIPDAEAANTVYEELKANEAFDEVAVKHGLSVGKISAYRGRELKKDIEDIVFALQEGDFSEPIETEGGFYIFRLTGIAPPRQPALSEVQEKVAGYLYNRKMQDVLTKWLNELKAKSYIKIY